MCVCVFVHSLDACTHSSITTADVCVSTIMSLHASDTSYFDCTFAIPRVASSSGGGNGDDGVSGNANLPHAASVVMSTSPDDEYTHWKQTVMYLEHPIQLREGDAISGTILCAANKKNPRDLDITVEYEYESGPNSEKIQRTQVWRLR